MQVLRFVSFLIGSLIVVALAIWVLFLTALSAKDITQGTEVVVSRGDSLRDISLKLQESGVIRSALAFQTLVSFEKNDRNIVAGTYVFGGPESAHTVADRLALGDFGTNSHAVTIPEGLTVKEISVLLSEKFDDFDTNHFVTIAQGLEGSLFPDTYFFHTDVTPEEVVAIMSENFKQKTDGLEKSARVSGHSFEEIITMASILEEEAMTADARGIVSGILWNRLEEGIPLQVDAVFLYIEELEGRNTYSLTADDLRIDSPYNTYTNAGLPPTPVTNPGLESIYAAANPIESDYLFYLSDTQGNMYYALTFDEHIENRQFLGY